MDDLKSHSSSNGSQYRAPTSPSYRPLDYSRRYSNNIFRYTRNSIGNMPLPANGEDIAPVDLNPLWGVPKSDPVAELSERMGRPLHN